MRQIELTPEQEEVLVEATGGSEAGDLVHVPCSELHQSVCLCDAWTDGSCLIFLETPMKNCQKFLYYLGAERTAVLEAHFREVTVYGAEDDGLSDYLTRFMGW
jgi:hypothetical protein